MENNIFYVYCHKKLTDGKCFYIGKGKNSRYNSKAGRNKYWWNIVNKYGFESEILINNISEQKAFEIESYFCTQIGYENLCNIRTEKGCGGYTMSESTKKKLSNSLKGKPKSSQTKYKISISNKGKKRSEEFKAQVSKRQTGHPYYQNPERNKKISSSAVGQKRSEETKQKMRKPKPKGFGEVLKGKSLTKEQCYKISEGRKGKGGKVVYQYDKQNNLINIFSSAKHASDFIKVHPVNMISHLNGKYKTCRGFIFKYNKL
jgi:hypothetical protein